MVAADRESLHKAIDELPDESITELQVLINFVQHKRTHPGSAWLRTLYDLFEPVRRGVEESGMTEEEVDAIIDQAIDEVRRDRAS